MPRFGNERSSDPEWSHHFNTISTDITPSSSPKPGTNEDWLKDNPENVKPTKWGRRSGHSKSKLRKGRNFKRTTKHIDARHKIGVNDRVVNTCTRTFNNPGASTSKQTNTFHAIPTQTTNFQSIPLPQQPTPFINPTFCSPGTCSYYNELTKLQMAYKQLLHAYEMKINESNNIQLATFKSFAK